MENDKIKELIKDMEDSKLQEINIEFPDGTKISMKKGITVDETNVEKNVVTKTESPGAETQKVNDETNSEANIEEGNFVTSPMVGTFYLKPSPTEKPYVEVGQRVEKGETLCIIEAMKLMNEIESEYSGEILEILVNDGESVEYGTKLFRIGE